MRLNFRRPILPVVAAALLVAGGARAQVTPAQGYEPVDDTPTVRPGVTIYTDYSYTEKPEVKDAAGNSIHQSSFNVSRAYMTIAGSLSHLISYRVTGDVQNDNNTTDSSLNGSAIFRLKYAYGQINFDEWVGKGSWIRIGANQTPWIDYNEGIYRYRFQGKIFTDAEGYLTSSDYGLSGHYNLPSNFGDLHLGLYNGEGYNSLADANGTNDQKSFQARFSLRPAPGVAVLNGLRINLFYDGDNYLKDSEKQRFLAGFTFENPVINAGFEYLDAKDQKTPAAADVHGEGWSAWATPRTSFGLEGLVRYDELKPNKDVSAKKQRLVVGIAYWFPVVKGVASSLMADYTSVKFDTALGKPDTRVYALHALFSF
jgi:hypothetical protein